MKFPSKRTLLPLNRSCPRFLGQLSTDLWTMVFNTTQFVSHHSWVLFSYGHSSSTSSSCSSCAIALGVNPAQDPLLTDFPKAGSFFDTQVSTQMSALQQSLPDLSSKISSPGPFCHITLDYFFLQQLLLSEIILIICLLPISIYFPALNRSPTRARHYLTQLCHIPSSQICVWHIVDT